MSEQALFDLQVAEVLTALASALCMQKGIDAQKLRFDFLDILEGISTGPEKVGPVAKEVAATMQKMIESAGETPVPGQRTSR